MNHIEIEAPCDLRGRKAAMLCQAFAELGAPAWIIFENRSVLASSRIGVESLGVKEGNAIVVVSNQSKQNVEDTFAFL